MVIFLIILTIKVCTVPCNIRTSVRTDHEVTWTILFSSSTVVPYHIIYHTIFQLCIEKLHSLHSFNFAMHLIPEYPVRYQLTFPLTEWHFHQLSSNNLKARDVILSLSTFSTQNEINKTCLFIPR
jgi:hypothetical protein